MPHYLKQILILGLITTIIACGSNRSLGSKIDDLLLVPNVFNSIEASDTAFKNNYNRVVVSSYRGVVLLTGQVSSSELKKKAEIEAIKIATAKKVHNFLEVTTPVNKSTKINDSAITARVKTRIAADSRLPSSDIKIITENSTVYLLGLVTQEQKQLILNAAKTISGVSQIVVLFNYYNEG